MMIHGIPSSIESPELQNVIDMVLSQIRQRAPEDFRRIRRRMRQFAPLPFEVPLDGCCTLLDLSIDVRTLAVMDLDLVPCVVELRESASHKIALVAHELGHVCTRYEDSNIRGEMPACEVPDDIADWYAKKWGFGRYIALSHGGIKLRTELPDTGTTRERFRRVRELRKLRESTDTAEIEKWKGLLAEEDSGTNP